MKEQWIEAPRIEGNQELAEKFGVSPMAMRLLRSRAGESEAEVRSLSVRNPGGSGGRPADEGHDGGRGAAA